MPVGPPDSHSTFLRCQTSMPHCNNTHDNGVVVQRREQVCHLQTQTTQILIDSAGVSQNTRILGKSWIADSQKVWDPNPRKACYAEFLGIGQCHKQLHYILHSKLFFVINCKNLFLHFCNRPSVFFSIDNFPVETQSDFFPRDAGNWSVTLKDGGWDNVTLQCDIINVAPAQNLKVQWTWIKGAENGKKSFFTCSTFSVRPKKPLAVLYERELNVIETITPSFFFLKFLRHFGRDQQRLHTQSCQISCK